MITALLIIIIVAMGYVIYKQHEEITILNMILDSASKQIEEAMKEVETK